MSSVQEIENAITKLKPEQVDQIAEWLEEYREEAWDRQIECDAKSGKLDKLIGKAKADARAGKGTPFP
jgi:hypothetical protein